MYRDFCACFQSTVPSLLVCFFICVLFFSLPAFCHLFHALCLRSSQGRAIMARIKSQSEPVCDLINFCYSDHL